MLFRSAGDLAVYFDPRSSGSMRDAVLEAIATERTLRERIVARRGELIQRFGTPTHAQDVLAPCAPPVRPTADFYFAGVRAGQDPAVGAL